MSSTYCTENEYQKYSVGHALSGNFVKPNRRTLGQADKLELVEVSSVVPRTETALGQFPSDEEIQRRIKSNMVASKVEVRIKVRYITGETEHATSLVFSVNCVKAKHVCAAMKVKLGLNSGEASLFSLWIIGKDLEYQIPLESNVLDVQRNWIKYLAKYTHSSLAIIGSNNPEVVGHILQYRKCALQNVAVEQRFKSMRVIDLIYGEAKFNIIKGRYPCSFKDAAILAGLILCSYLGPYNPDRHIPGYIKCGLYNYVLPNAVLRAASPAKWEYILRKSHEQFSNLSLYQVRVHLVSYVRRWLCYGASYFPVCAQKPASKFFEYRSQMWYIGVNVTGLFIFDSYNYVHIFSASWYSVLRVNYSTDTIWFHFKKNKTDSEFKKSRVKKNNIMKLYSPQAPLIYNLVLKCRTMHILDTTLARNDIVKAYPNQVRQLPNAFLHSLEKSEDCNGKIYPEASKTNPSTPTYGMLSSEKAIPQYEPQQKKSQDILKCSNVNSSRLSALDADSSKGEAIIPESKNRNSSKNKNHPNKDDRAKGKKFLETAFGRKSKPKYDLFYPKWPSMDTQNGIAIPRLQRGPVRVPKKDIYCKFGCDMASPDKNFRQLASTSVMNIDCPSVSRNKLL